MTDKTDKKVESLITKLMVGGDYERGKAAEALGLRGSIQGCINAAAELGIIGDSRAVPVLVQVSKDKKRHSRVQFYSSYALGEIQNPQAIPALIEALNDKGIDTLTYQRVVKSLIAMRNPQAVPGLIQALSGKADQARIEAAEALGNLKDKRAVPPLIAALNDRQSVTQDRTDEYGTMYVGTTQYVCNEAASALGKIGDASAVPALDKVWRSERHQSHTRTRAIRALGEIGGPLAVHSLIEAVSDPEHGKEAVKALVGVGPEAFPALVEALGRETDRASHGAAPPPETRPPEPLVSQLLPALIEVLGTKIESIGMGEDWWTRGRAAELLKAIAQHHPDPALRAALPILRRLRLLSRDPVFREALEQIESVTAASKSLPLPASAPPPDPKTLPRPATAADVPCSGPTASAEGWWTRLRRALKSS